VPVSGSWFPGGNPAPLNAVSKAPRTVTGVSMPSESAPDEEDQLARFAMAPVLPVSGRSRRSGLARLDTAPPPGQHNRLVDHTIIVSVTDIECNRRRPFAAAIGPRSAALFARQMRPPLLR
jgi:hypothetical protein